MGPTCVTRYIVAFIAIFESTSPGASATDEPSPPVGREVLLVAVAQPAADAPPRITALLAGGLGSDTVVVTGGSQSVLQLRDAAYGTFVPWTVPLVMQLPNTGPAPAPDASATPAALLGPVSLAVMVSTLVNARYKPRHHIPDYRWARANVTRRRPRVAAARSLRRRRGAVQGRSQFLKESTMRYRTSEHRRRWLRYSLLILLVVAGGSGWLLRHARDTTTQPVSPATRDLPADAGCSATQAAIRYFTVVNASGTAPDPKGGPAFQLVGHDLILQAAVSPQVGMVRFSTSAGPLSPPDDLVSIDVPVSAQQLAEATITVSGRPDRVIADAFLREELARVCGVPQPALLGERMLKLWITP